MTLSADRNSSAGNQNPSSLHRLRELFYYRVLPLSRPSDLCVLIFVMVVVALFFAIDQPFLWVAFWVYIKDPLIWFSALMAPLFLILVTEDRVGDAYDIKRTGNRFLSGFGKFLRDFFPFVICLVVYLNLSEIVYKINPVNKDPLLIAIDQALFGVQLSQWFEQFSSVLLNEWMYLCYSLFGWYPFVLIAFFLARGLWKPFRHLLLAYILASFIGYIGYITVPAIGPRYYLDYTVDLRGQFFATIEWAMKNYLYVPRDCFPSLHTANTLVVLGMAYRYRRDVFWAMLPFCASTVVATVYLRYHYVIDVLAGAALAAFALVVAPRWNDRWDAWTEGIRKEAVRRGFLSTEVSSAQAEQAGQAASSEGGH